jgi:hypothetical protein
MKNVNIFMRRINICLFILLSVFVIFFSSFIINVLAGRLFNCFLEDLSTGMSIYYFFFLAVIFAPLFETRIFQKFLIEVSIKILERFKRRSFIIPILISAVGFGMSHYYSILYVINTVSIGIVLAYTYSIVRERKENAYWVVASIHALVNTLAFVTDNLSGLQPGR